MEILGAGGAKRSNQVYFQRVMRKLKAAGISGGGSTDEVEISDVGRFLSHLSRLPAVRQDKVDALRRRIENDEYDIDGKVEEILDSILEDLGIPPARVSG